MISSRGYRSRNGRLFHTGWRVPPTLQRPTYTPFRGEPDAAPVRLIVRRVRPTPGSQLALFASYSYHAFITDREGDTLRLEADHRRHAEIENAIRDLKYGVGLNHLPSGRFAANAAWLAVQALAHTLARWTSRIGLGRAGADHKDPQTTLLRPGRTAYTLGAPSHSASPAGLALGNTVQRSPGATALLATPCLTAVPAKRYANLILIDRTDQGLLNSRRTDRQVLPAAFGASRSASHTCRSLSCGLSAAHLPEIRPDHRALGSTLSPLQHRHNVLRWIRAKAPVKTPSSTSRR